MDKNYVPLGHKELSKLTKSRICLSHDKATQKIKKDNCNHFNKFNIIAEELYV